MKWHQFAFLLATSFTVILMNISSMHWKLLDRSNRRSTSKPSLMFCCHKWTWLPLTVIARKSGLGDSKPWWKSNLSSLMDSGIARCKGITELTSNKYRYFPLLLSQQDCNLHQATEASYDIQTFPGVKTINKRESKMDWGNTSDFHCGIKGQYIFQ